MYIFVIYYYQVSCLIFICYVLDPKKKDEPIEYQLVNIIPELNLTGNGFLHYLSDILKGLPYEEKRTLEKKNDTFSLQNGKKSKTYQII